MLICIIQSMLTNLRLENFVLLEHIELEFGSGLTTFTGETGAGKSILVEAISLLLGQTAGEELIKTDQDVAIVEGIFELNPLHNAALSDFITDGKQLIVTRKICRGKGSSARLNGQTVPLKTLKELMKNLANISGQHEYLSLFDNQTQINLLDSYSPALNQTKTVFSEKYQEFNLLLKKLQQNNADHAELSKKKEFLAFQINDINQNNFQDDEDLCLERQKKEINNLHLIQSSLTKLVSNIENSQKLAAENQLILAKLGPIENKYQELATFFQTNNLDMDDRLVFLQTRLQQTSFLDDKAIDEIENRLDLIFKYKNKYRQGSLAGLLAYGRNLKEELAELENWAHNLEELENQRKTLENQLLAHAAALSKQRTDVATTLSAEIQRLLCGLHLPHCRFQIDVQYQPQNIQTSGADQIVFMVAPNPGEPLKPLSKIASGGELSRILLAIKTVFLQQNLVDTWIFDEVDAGIGGLTAVKIGEYLKLLAQHVQVFCVTHLPQIAKFADHHYLINKQADHKKTYVDIKLLSSGEKQLELQRMLGGAEVLNFVASQT